MAKLGYYAEDGVEYWTLKALKEYLGVTDNALWYYRRLGALIRVRTERGLYFRVNVGWEIRNSYVLARVERGEKVIAKVDDEYEMLRTREIKKEQLKEDDYLKIYTAQEIMRMEGIDDLEVHIRMRNAMVGSCSEPMRNGTACRNTRRKSGPMQATAITWYSKTRASIRRNWTGFVVYNFAK